MHDSSTIVLAWHRVGNATSLDRLGLFAQALVEHRVGPYSVLTDAEEDEAVLALFRVDRPRATIADIRQTPPLALSSYYQLLHDLARAGLGPHPLPRANGSMPGRTVESPSRWAQ